ncbi:MAG: type IV pilus assembly protein PilM [bacterium]
MANPLNLAKKGFGLKIFDSSVKVFQFNKSGKKYSLHGYASASLDEGVVVGGDIIKADILSTAIKNALKNAKPKSIKTPYVSLMLPHEKTFYKTLKLPIMADDEIEEAVRWKLSSLTPWDEEVVFDYQVIKKRKDSLTTFVSASPMTHVRSYYDLLADLKLIPTVIDLEEAATTRAIVLKDSEEKLLIADIGKGRTLFTAVNAGNIVFTSASKVSGVEFTKIIADGMGVSMNEAEELKMKAYSSSEDNKDKKLLSVLEPLFKTFSDEIHNIIEYLERERHISGIKKVILCGGSSNLHGFAPYIALQIPFQVDVADPWQILGKASKKAAKKIKTVDVLSFIKVMGLALRALDPFDYENDKNKSTSKKREK